MIDRGNGPQSYPRNEKARTVEKADRVRYLAVRDSRRELRTSLIHLVAAKKLSEKGLEWSLKPTFLVPEAPKSGFFDRFVDL